MAAAAQRPKLLVIVGPTASGKSELAMRLALKFNGEIVSADSRMVYKGMDVGTGKPTIGEQSTLVHHLIDVVEPNQFFSVADYKRLAMKAIADILARGKLPVMVGGSGLYVDSVLYDYEFLPPSDASERKKLNKLSVSELRQEVKKRGLTPPLNHMNKRHLVRTLETAGKLARKKNPIEGALVIGLWPPTEKLRAKIVQRNERMIANGLLDEVKELRDKYGNSAALDAIGYKEWRRYFSSEETVEQVRERITHSSILYAKRQRTWFKRNKKILWFGDIDSAEHAVSKLLNT